MLGGFEPVGLLQAPRLGRSTHASFQQHLSPPFITAIQPPARAFTPTHPPTHPSHTHTHHPSDTIPHASTHAPAAPLSQAGASFPLREQRALQAADAAVLRGVHRLHAPPHQRARQPQVLLPRGHGGGHRLGGLCVPGWGCWWGWGGGSCLLEASAPVAVGWSPPAGWTELHHHHHHHHHHYMYTSPGKTALHITAHPLQGKPENLAWVVSDLKRKHGVQYIYCWHGLPAYWAGGAGQGQATSTDPFRFVCGGGRGGEFVHFSHY